MTGRASRVYLVGGVVALGCYLALPHVAGSSWLFEVTGLSAAVAIGVGVLRYRPRPMLPWILFIVAQVLFISGDFFYYTNNLQFPSAADGLYIAYYPLQAAGLLLLIRSRTPGRDTASLVDAVIITVGFALLSWVYLIEPYTRDVDSLVPSVVSVAYPTMDVLLLAVAVRLFMGNGGRPRAFYLMMASILCLIVTDGIYGIIQLNGSYTMGSWLDVGWMITYLLWGAAALHPSMRELSARAPHSGASLTGKRILLLAAATLVAPGVLVSQWDSGGPNVPVAAVGSAVLFILVMIRMLGLVSDLRDAVGRHERAEQRETILRRAATTLTAAPDREFVRLAALEGAIALTREVPDAAVEIDLGEGPAPAPVTTNTSAQAFVVSLATRASPYGRMVVTSSAALPADMMDGLGTLGAQVALALETVALGEAMSQQRIEARVGALVQNSSDMIMVVDDELKIRYATPSVARALGHRIEDLAGTLATSVSEPAQAAAITGFYRRLMKHPGMSVTAEWRMRHANGRLVDVEAVVTNLLDNPSVGGIVVTAHDITDRKALEQGLKRQVRELEELDRIRGEFVATVSHELRTPLTSIIGEAEMLVDGVLGELSGRQHHGVEVIGRNGERLLSLIDDLLTLNHIETSELALQREPTSVAGLVDSLRSQVGPAAAAKSISLSLSCGPDAGLMLADREQLERALLNLLTNAIKFTPDGGAVTLHAARDGADEVFTISDTGMGIPADEQSGLFTRFFRSSVATRMAIQGTGLGLVIVKQIVEEHGGTITVVSTQGAGTTVTVRIPAMPAEATAGAA